MKYSIITVNYNNREGLRKTIESVIHQTFRDYEFIVIDGGSTDGSAEVLQEYDARIDYWVSEPDKGIYHAMNKGIAQSHGDYLNFMNSGDCFYSDNILQIVSDYGYDTDIITGRDYHYSKEKQQGHASVQPARMSMLTFFNSTLDHQSSFIKRELFKDTLYREDFRLVSDWIFFLEKTVIDGKNVQFIPDIICFRETPGITAQQYEKNLQEKDAYLHQMLPDGVYKDYQSLSSLDKEQQYTLFNMLDHPFKRSILKFFLKISARL